MQQQQAPLESFTQTQHTLLSLLHWLAQQHYSFVTISPLSHAHYLARQGHITATNLRDIFGWNLLFSKDLLPPDLFTHLKDQQLIRHTAHGWQSVIRVSSLNRQLFVHSAYPTHDAQSVFFGPDTYRFVTALDGWIAAEKPHIQRAIELCCGSAPAALSVAAHYPAAEVFATDINPVALQYASVNAQANQTPNVLAQQSNLFEQVDGNFDLITANPPYLIDSKSRLYRHGGGLLGAELSLNILQQSLPRLAVNGSLVLYTGVVICQGHDLFYAAAQSCLSDHADYDWRYTEIDPDVFADELNQGDYPNADRIAAVILVVKRLV
jgi:hypothetical protein